MINTPEQEREEIRNNRTAAIYRIIKLLLRIVLTLARSQPVPATWLQNVYEIYRDQLDLEDRAHAIGDEPLPDKTGLDPLELTIGEIIDTEFPQTGSAKAIFEALFEIANRLQTLESKPLITREQLRAWLINKAS